MGIEITDDLDSTSTAPVTNTDILSLDQEKLIRDVGETTTSDDSDDVEDIARGLLRSFNKQVTEVKGSAPALINKEQLRTRSERIEGAIERLPGEENTLGLIRTGYSIASWMVNNIVGVANTILVPLDIGIDTGVKDPDATETLITKPQKIYDTKRYEKYYNKLRKKNNWIESYFSTAYKIFKESPELKNDGEFIKGVIDRLANYEGTVSAREADELTAFWRPEASVAEQAIRVIPELGIGTVAGIKFLLRRSKKVVAQAEKIMGKSILQATDDDIREATLKMMDDAIFPLAKAAGGVRRAMFGRRVGAVLTLKQKPLYRTLLKNNAAVRSAKDKLALAKTSSDKALIARESASLSLARNTRINSIPKEILEIAATEAGAVLGATIAGNQFGEEFGTLFGALGGGFGASIGFNSLYKFASNAGKGIGGLIVFFGSIVGALDDDQIKALAKKGVIPRISHLSSADQKSLQDFATFIRALPEEDRTNAFAQLKLIDDIRVDLQKAGVDPELLEVTMGKATGLVPLMMMREAITSGYNKIDMSKGAKKLDKNLAVLLKNDRDIDKQFDELRGLVERLAGAAGDAGVQNSKFDAFVKSMQTVSAKETEQLGQDKVAFTNLIDDILDLLADPLVTKSVEDKKTLDELISQLMKSSFLDDANYPRDAAGRILKDDAIGDLAEVGSRQIDKSDRAAAEVETKLIRFLDSYLDPEKYQLNAEEAAENLAKYAKNRKTVITEEAGARFEALKKYGDAIDITDWLDDLYGTADDVIARTRMDKIKQVLKGKKLGNASTLEALSNIEGKTNVIDALESSPELKDAILTELKQSLRDAGDTEDYIATIDDIDYDQIKIFFNKKYKGEKGDDLNDFDIFKIAQLISKELGLPDLKITATISDIQEYSSAFSIEASKMYNVAGKGDLAKKMGDLSKSIVNTIPEKGEAGQAIRSAKKNYIDNVIARYSDKENNPLGYNVSDFIYGGRHKVDPVKWVDIEKIISGDIQAGTDIVNQLKKTFGEYSEETGKYTLSPKSKLIVRNLMNDLLSRHISQSTTVRSGKKLIPSQGKLGDDKKLVEGRLAARARSVGGDAIDSPALDALQREGLIDIDRVKEYNLAVENFFNRSDILKNAEDALDREVTNAAKRVREQVNLREKFLQNMGKFDAEQQAAGEINDYDRFLKFFILNPQGQRRMDTLIPKIAKEMGINEREMKDLMSDLTIESISRASYGRMREVVNRPGQVLRDFDHESLYSLVLDKDISERVRGVLGDDKFNSLTRMAQFLMIQNREIAAKMKDAGINVTTPKGLSIESLLSRTYSVARGVISPKYVATEVALLSFRKKKANALARILNDPKMVDAVIEIIETEGVVIRKYNVNVFTALVNGLGYYESMENKQKTKTQIRELELDRLRSK